MSRFVLKSFASRLRSLFDKRPQRRAVPLALAAACACSIWSSTASAQGWLADRRYAEGPGIRTGDLELHPGVGGEVGYDSNWFLRSSTEGPNIANGAPAAPPRDAAIFRLTPSLYVSPLSRQRDLDAGGARYEPRFVTFRGGVSATARAFIGKEMSRQHNIGVQSDARLDLNQGRPISVGLFAGYNRLIQPQVLADPNLSFNRSDLRAGTELIFIPGMGTLDLRPGYQFQAALFEESNGVPYTNLTHEVSFKNRWRFRPRTALISDTSLRFINYPNSDRALNYLNDSTPLRTRFGLTGLITNRVSVLAVAGYGATFFQNPEAAASRQYNSVNFQGEGTFYIGQGQGGTDEPGQATLLLSSVSLGVLRDFQTSLLANFYNVNRAYARLEYWFGGRVVVRFDAFGEILEYPQAFFNNPGGGGVPVAATAGDFTNHRVGGGLFGEYRFTSSFGVNTTIDYVQQFSDTQLVSGVVPGTATPTVFDLNYNRFQAFLGARFFF